MIERRLSLLHIEDDSLWQTVIAAALAGAPCVRHFQSASTGRDGLAIAAALRPDVVLLDVRLPDSDGIALAADLMGLACPPRIILLSARQDAAVLHAASEPHIAGLLWKVGDVIAQLPCAIETVARGGKYYPPDVRAALRRFRADPRAFFKMLSARELELLPHFGRGDTDDEIAAALGRSAHTVRSHRQNVMRKLGLASTARLTHWVITNGFATSATSGTSGTSA